MWKTALPGALVTLAAFAFAVICPVSHAEVLQPQPIPKGRIIDVFPPPPSAPGSVVDLWAVISNTGSEPWPAGTKLNFRIEMNGAVLAEKAANVSREPVGSRRLESARIKLPKNAVPGKYSLIAEIKSVDSTIAAFKRSTDLYIDPFAFFDGFERNAVTAGGWEMKKSNGGNKVVTCKDTYYTGCRSLKLELNGGGKAHLQYEFGKSQPEQIAVSMRLRFDEGALLSEGPLNFVHFFDQSNNIAAYAYYYTGERRIQLAYLNELGEWVHDRLAEYRFFANTWYHVTARIKTGKRGHFTISVDGEEILVAKDNFAYGSISYLNIGHFPSDKRIAGNIYIDDVRWAQQGIDTLGRGRVSITFDDGTLSQWENAKGYLDEFGYKASFYIITDDSADPYDLQTGVVYAMNPQQVLALQDQGHVIGSHTDKHLPLTKIPKAKANSELCVSKQRLESWGIRVSSLCFPYGDYNTAVLNLAKKQYDFCLTTKEGLNVYDAVTGRLRLMRVDPVAKKCHTIKYWIDQAKKTGTWLVLYYHSVGPGHKHDGYWERNRKFKKTLHHIRKRKLDVIPIELAPPRQSS